MQWLIEWIHEARGYYLSPVLRENCYYNPYMHIMQALDEPDNFLHMNASLVSPDMASGHCWNYSLGHEFQSSFFTFSCLACIAGISCQTAGSSYNFLLPTSWFQLCWHHLIWSIWHASQDNYTLYKYACIWRHYNHIWTDQLVLFMKELHWGWLCLHARPLQAICWGGWSAPVTRWSVTWMENEADCPWTVNAWLNHSRLSVHG